MQDLGHHYCCFRQYNWQQNKFSDLLEQYRGNEAYQNTEANTILNLAVVIDLSKSDKDRISEIRKENKREKLQY